ncbi:MAG: D-tyrosyl-tRNA(Tyr) deacylase [Clostridia bacterium]|nr:D-tyrosyl-tRNA(Tyr) deacylase [Clostridia bacterium]
MKAVIQRVLGATLKVDGSTVSEIKKGLVVFLGVGKGDEIKDCDFFIKKLPALRIFEDENGKINRSVLDEKGEILLVSQFTLFADTSHGNRPSFLDAELPERADELYRYVGAGLEKVVPVKYGVFGADMKIEQVNDGPFTVIMESR